MMNYSSNRIHALLFGLSADLAGELLLPLGKFCSNIQSVDRGRVNDQLLVVADSPAQIIFCGTDTSVVSKLRETKPEAPIVVVSRHAEVSRWLDSIEAGATDYCAAPFETAQVQWIVESSLRAAQTAVSA